MGLRLSSKGRIRGGSPSLKHGKRISQRGARTAQASNGRLEIAAPETGVSNRGFRCGYFLPAGVSHKPCRQSGPAVHRALVRLPNQTPFLHAPPDSSRSSNRNGKRAVAQSKII
jgi:hypothetical protein